MQVLVYMRIQRSEGNSYHVTAGIGAQFNDLVGRKHLYLQALRGVLFAESSTSCYRTLSASSVARELRMNRSFHLVNEQGDWEALVLQI